MNSANLIARDRNRLLSELRKLLPTGTPYAFIEFPNYGNVGDSAIWLGSMSLLREATGRAPGYVSFAAKYGTDKLIEDVPEGPIVLQGGGNFGDIHPWAQKFRERIIAEFPNRRIIIMPQSIKFRDPAAAADSAHAMTGHRDLHLLVRDETSLALARDQIGLASTLAPDAAFGLGALQRNAAVKFDILPLLRVDEEMVGYDLAALRELEAAQPVDWITDPEGFEVSSFKRAKLLSLVYGKLTWPDRKLFIYLHQARKRLNRGLKLLSEGRYVLTDRLHAHILSTLLDIPHVCLDNDYGKIHSYIDAFTKDYDGVQKATSMKEAVDKVRALAAA